MQWAEAVGVKWPAALVASCAGITKGSGNFFRTYFSCGKDQRGVSFQRFDLGQSGFKQA